MRFIIFFLIILASCQNEESRNLPEPTDEQLKVIQNQLNQENQNGLATHSTQIPVENNNQDYHNNTNYQEQSDIEDGEHEAEVQYYNPHTGTSSTYTLTVDVENGEVVKIYWPNGGWLDESHFTGADLDEDGNASFTSDKGYEYNITITDIESSNDQGSNNQNDEDDNENTDDDQ